MPDKPRHFNARQFNNASADFSFNRMTKLSTARLKLVMEDLEKLSETNCSFWLFRMQGWLQRVAREELAVRTVRASKEREESDVV